MEYFAHGDVMDGHDMMGGTDYSSWLFALLWLVIIAIAVVLLVKYLGKPASDQKNEDPIEVIKARYAKGEIDKKEFEEKKKALK